MTGPRPTLRAVVVDDEAPARALMREYLAAHPDLEVVAECANGFEAVKRIGEVRPDVVFLDVQMPKLDGFEVLELLEPGPAVVFCTAYDEFAIRAFEVHAVDYLLKPFGRQRLAEALDRVRARRAPGGGVVAETPAGAGGTPGAVAGGGTNAAGTPPAGTPEPAPAETDEPGPPPAGPPSAAAIANAARPPGHHLERILVREGANVHVIPVETVDFLEAQDDYVSVHAGGKSWLKQQPLTDLAAGLDPARFVRIHRSYVLNVERIARLELYAKDSRVAILRDGAQLPVSRSGYQRLRELM